MNDAPQDLLPVTVHILDKDFQISCQRGEQDSLMASARYLDQRMREVRQSGRFIGLDRIAVLTALNITHELLQLRKAHNICDDTLVQRILSLHRTIEIALNQPPHL